MQPKKAKKRKEKQRKEKKRKQKKRKEKKRKEKKRPLPIYEHEWIKKWEAIEKNPQEAMTGRT